MTLKRYKMKFEEDEEGEIVDYADVMKQMDADKRMILFLELELKAEQTYTASLRSSNQRILNRTFIEKLKDLF